MFSTATGARDESLQPVEPYGHERVSFSADGTLCAVRSKPRVGEPNLKIYRVPGFALLRTIRDTDVSSGDFWWMPDGKTLILQNNARVSLWSVETGENVATFNVAEEIKAISPDGKYVAAARTEPQAGQAHQLGYRIQIIPVASPSDRVSFVAHKQWIADLAFSPDGKTLASVSCDKMLKLWSVPDGKLIRTLEGHDGIVKGVRFLPDGKTIITGARDETIRLWDAASGAEIGRYTVPGSSITCLDLSSDETMLAVGDENGKVSLMDFRRLRTRAESELATGQVKR